MTVRLSVITGGQTGPDTWGAFWAIRAGIPTQIILPKGRRREESCPAWMTTKGGLTVTELASADYRNRTVDVVNACGACLIIAPRGNSTPGTKLTLELCRKQNIQIWWADPYYHDHEGNPDNIAAWLWQLGVWGGSIKLMIAGPRGSHWPNTGPARVKEMLTNTFDIYCKTPPF